MARRKVLITVTTYPLPSRSYDELVCTAGILENGDWIRIYPIPLSFLFDLKNSNKLEQVKYRWIELDLVKRKDDFRPESHSPKHYDFRDIVVHHSIDTKGNWMERKNLCCQKVYTDLGQLIEDSKDPTNVSLATFRPTKIKRLVIENDSREWKDEWKEIRKQGDLFTDGADPETMIRKLPYKFSYEFEDDKGKRSTLMIEDWEIGALYWKCLDGAKGDETVALEKVRQMYESEFLSKKDIHLFLGTTKEGHMRRWPNPWVIIGVFYPNREVQMRLF
jgi:hypothetical protein